MTERAYYLRRIDALVESTPLVGARTVLPSRSLTDQAKPFRYTTAVNTDVTRTWRKFRLLLRLRERLGRRLQERLGRRQQAHDTSGPGTL